MPSGPDGFVLVLPHTLNCTTGSLTVWNVSFLWQGVSSLVVLWLYRPAYRGLRRAADVSRSPSRIHFTKRVNTLLTYLTFFHVQIQKRQIIRLGFFLCVFSGTKKHKSPYIFIWTLEDTPKSLQGMLGRTFICTYAGYPVPNSASLPSKEPKLVVLMTPRHVWTRSFHQRLALNYQRQPVCLGVWKKKKNNNKLTAGSSVGKHFICCSPLHFIWPLF